MTRVGIAGYGGGSVRMAAASAAIDSGVAIDVVLSTGRGQAGQCSISSTIVLGSGLLFLWSAALRWLDQAFKSQCGVQVPKP